MIESLHSYMRLLSMKDSTWIELFYFYDNFRRIAQCVLAFRLDRPIKQINVHVDGSGCMDMLKFGSCNWLH